MTQVKAEVMHLAELKQKSIADLNEVARDLKIEGAANLRKQELIFAILQAQTSCANCRPSRNCRLDRTSRSPVRPFSG